MGTLLRFISCAFILSGCETRPDDGGAPDRGLQVAAVSTPAADPDATAPPANPSILTEPYQPPFLVVDGTSKRPLLPTDDLSKMTWIGSTVLMVKPFPEPWFYVNYQDEMTNEMTYLASTETVDPVTFGFPYHEPQNPTLVVRKTARSLNVILRMARGQFMCSSWDGCSVLVRFDADPAERYSASGSASHDPTVLFINNERKFTARAAKANSIMIEALFFREGARRLKFKPGPLVISSGSLPKQKPPKRGAASPDKEIQMMVDGIINR